MQAQSGAHIAEGPRQPTRRIKRIQVAAAGKRWNKYRTCIAKWEVKRETADIARPKFGGLAHREIAPANSM
jgi:hypothetical protein